MNKLLLSKEIFNIKILERAILDYSKLAKISYSESESYFVCIFEKSLYPLDETKKEFENYLIDLQSRLVLRNDSN